MEDEQLSRIRERFTSNRLLRDCLLQVPGMGAQKVEQTIRQKEKNGLAEISSKAADGRWYVNVDDFIAWVDGGRRKAG